MPNVPDFRETTQEELRVGLAQWGYIGGSNITDILKFRQYVRGKKVVEKKTGEPRNEFAHCSYSPTKNARQAEDALLDAVDSEMLLYNDHCSSNLYDEPGFVYVLHD